VTVLKSAISLSVALLLLTTVAVFGESDTAPTIVIYSGVDSGFAEMMATLIEEDGRIDSEVKVLKSADLVALATTLPQTECIIIYASNKAEDEGLGPSLITFFEQGGGLIGIKEITYEPSVGDLARDVFPTFANASVSKLNPREKRVRNYVKADSSEIAEGLPDSFELLSMGVYFSGDAAGDYMQIPGDYGVPYRDGETGAPIVLTDQNEEGGRSVSLPGVWVVPSSRIDIYYGNVVADENFVGLFTNSVLWAAKGSTRFTEVTQDLDAKLEEARGKQDRLKEAAEQARKKENTRRTILLAGVWAAGLLACAVIIKKLVLAPIELED
jgi:hypothetical protein